MGRWGDPERFMGRFRRNNTFSNDDLMHLYEKTAASGQEKTEKKHHQDIFFEIIFSCGSPRSNTGKTHIFLLKRRK